LYIRMVEDKRRVIPLAMATGRDLISIPYVSHPSTPILKSTYVGREIAVAGAGCIFHREITCGKKDMVVSVPDIKPNVSVNLFFIDLIIINLFAYL